MGWLLATGAQAQVQYGSLERIAFQFDQQQQRGGSSIVGDWHQTKQISSGGVLHMYFTYGADGSFRYTSLQVGGALNANGTRTQVWGRYQAQPQQDGSVLVTYRLTGHAPTQTCMPGQGCHPNAAPPSGTTTDSVRIHGNTLETGGSQMQRDTVPPALQAQLPGDVESAAATAAAGTYSHRWQHWRRALYSNDAFHGEELPEQPYGRGEVLPE